MTGGLLICCGYSNVCHRREPFIASACVEPGSDDILSVDSLGWGIFSHRLQHSIVPIDYDSLTFWVISFCLGVNSAKQ
jgi:hypothetical protein